MNFYFDKGSLLTKQIPIYMALLKYGHENFTFEIIQYCEPNEAVILEQTYLDKFDFDYNINVKANSILGYKHTPETLAKMKGRQNFKGKTHSKETIQGIKDRNTAWSDKKRKDKQLNNTIKLSNIFKQVSLNGKIPRYGVLPNISEPVKITDISNNKSILFNTKKDASSVLCASVYLLEKRAKNGNLFSYFEWDNLNNCLIETKLLITFENNV